MEIDSPYRQDHVDLLRDLESWQTRNANRISLDDKSITEDGRLVLNLAINDTKFQLICPSDYPDQDEVFFLETDCTDFWCVALNEFLIDYPKRLTLDLVLEKTFLYYTPSSLASSLSRDKYLDELSESDSDTENEDDSESSEINDREYIMNLKKREWKRKEGELRLIYNRPKISDMFDGIKIGGNGEEERQVFSNSAASLILVNDLINIMERGESNGFLVEPIDNDIFRWSVMLKNFNRGSNIFKDLSKIKDIYGYDWIEIELNFPMDLYPFHPPILKLIGPKLIGVFDNEEFVKFFNWNPARDMAFLLKEIKNYFENNATIDIYHKINGVHLIRLNEILKNLTETILSHNRNYSELFVNSSIEKILNKLLKNLKIIDEFENSTLNSRISAKDTMQNKINHRSYFHFYFLPDGNKTLSSLKTNPRFIKNEKENYLHKNNNNKTNFVYYNKRKMEINDKCCGSKNVNITTNPSFEFDSKNSNEFNGVLSDNLIHDSCEKFRATDFRDSKINNQCANDDLISTFGYGKIKNSEGK